MMTHGNESQSMTQSDRGLVANESGEQFVTLTKPCYCLNSYDAHSGKSENRFILVG